MSEARLSFGAVAAEYDAIRPSYPDEMFDEIVAFGGLRAGDAALEIGAGTGKATVSMLERGLRVHCLEPSAEMAAVLQAKGVDVEETLFEEWQVRGSTYRVAFAAQSWHWVESADRYERLREALTPGGVVALFWNKPRELEGPLGAAIEAVYDELAPELRGGAPSTWNLDATLDELADAFDEPHKRVFTATRVYSQPEYRELCSTWSTHRMLAPERRAHLLAAIGHAIDDHGGAVEVVYDAQCYLARRR